MVEVADILAPIQITLFVLMIILAFVYLIPIILIRRFHNVHNVFTVNFCFAAICCDTYWLVNCILTNYFPISISNTTACLILNYFGTMCTIQVPLAIIGMSIHRLCSVVYHAKVFFQRKQWIIICILSEWTVGIIFALPQLSTINSPCESALWLDCYSFVMVVIIPALICLILNMSIFNFVRSSTNRVQPSSMTVTNPQHINRRDKHLLRHIIIMFSIFVGGWSPVFICPLIRVKYSSFIYVIFMMLAEVSLLSSIINLFIYTHELREYLFRSL